MRMRVADYIAQFIERSGIRDVFLLSGGGIMHLTDGLACNDRINAVCFHHEQAAAMALDAYSRVTGNFAVGYFTTGPGATNAITGLAGAWLDSVPCLFISGQVKRKEAVYNAGIRGIRQIGVQEINIIPVVKSMTKYCAMMNRPEDVRYHLEKAVFLAKSGRPGPAWLDIPLDVQGAFVETEALKSYRPRMKKPRVTHDQLEQLLSYLGSAQRPVVLAGQGVRISGAIDSLLRWVRQYNIPVVTSFLGIDVIGSESPNYTGRIGIKGDRAGNLALQNSDLLIVIGSSLPVAEIGYEYDQFARAAKKVVIDIDATAHKKRTITIDLLCECDANAFITTLSSQMEERQMTFSRSWLDRCISWRTRYPVSLPEYALRKDRVNLYYFMDFLSAKLGSEDIVVTDAGSAFYAGCQAVKIRQGMRYITSGGFATMGFSVPASIGACVASGNRRVMCITGDGSLQLNIQELQTIVHHGYPVKMFIFNNGGYLSIRTTQSRFFENRLIGEGSTSGVSFPDLKKIANAYGIPFYRIRDNQDLGPIIEKVITTEGPALCEVMTPGDQEIIPTVSSQKMEDGTMVSKPLEDMYPFLDRKEFLSNMLVRPLDN